MDQMEDGVQGNSHMHTEITAMATSVLNSMIHTQGGMSVLHVLIVLFSTAEHGFCGCVWCCAVFCLT